MQYRKLGANGPDVPEIAFGAWAAGGRGWGEVDDKETVAAIRRSVNLGASLIDTAEVYGGGHSEEIVGEAMKGLPRNEVFVATKVSGNDLSPMAIQKAVDGSLKRLRLDHIDLYQMHWPDQEHDLQESMRAMDDLVREGKVRFVGASNFDVSQMETCLEVRHLDSLQPPLDMLRRDIESTVLPFCHERGIGVIVYSPMAKGLLTGKYQSGDTFPQGDVRAVDSRFQGGAFERNLRIVEQLRGIAQRLQCSLAQLAIAWTLTRPGVTAAIVGAKRSSQVEENVGAAGVSLSETELAEIEGILSTTM